MDATQLSKVASVQTLILDLLTAKLSAKTAQSADVTALVTALATLTQLDQVEQKNIVVTAALSGSPATAKPSDLEVVSIFA